MKVHFETEIDSLKKMVVELATMVEDAVRDAVNSVKNDDHALAKKVIDNDSEIDRLEVKIEEECLKIMALYQPVAGDLRYVVTLLKVNNELERIGDNAVTIAAREYETTKDLHKNSILKLDELFKEVRYMLKGALDAFVCRDSLKALEIIRHDDIVDELHRDSYIRVAEEVQKAPEFTAVFLGQLTISRCLERIADCATNIAEDLIYLEQGRIVRHAPKFEQ